ncbi:MAG: hypothetical protein ABL892_11435, partial [Thiobacillaceae bacterium]
AAGFLAGAAFLATGFLATAFLAAGFLAGAAFLATGFLATAFLAAGFLAGAAFLATGFLAGAAFFATGFLAGAAFFAGAFFAVAIHHSLEVKHNYYVYKTCSLSALPKRGINLGHSQKTDNARNPCETGDTEAPLGEFILVAFF